MDKKITIAGLFILSIFIVSGYFLWQIDKYEKALWGQEWITPVPYGEGQNDLKGKENYKKIVENYKENNSQLIKTLTDYRDLPLSLRDVLLLNVFPPPGTNLDTDEVMIAFENKYFKIPKEFFIPYQTIDVFKQEEPEEYKVWKNILEDLLANQLFVNSVPSNLPIFIIWQSISSLYRYLFMCDGVLVFVLIILLITCQENEMECSSYKKNG